MEIYNQDGTVSTADDSGTTLPPRIPVFHATVSVDGGYDDNVRTSGSWQGSLSGSGQGSLFTSENLSLSYDLHGGATEVHLITGAGFTYYFDATNTRSSDVNANVALSLTHQSSSRLTFAASVSATYQTEPDFSSNVGPENLRANFFQTADSFSTTYHWLLRFATVTSYNFRLIKYDQSSIGAFEDRVEDTFGEQFQFSLSRRTSLVGEYRFEMINYDSAPRDSVTHSALAGIDHNFTEQLNLHLRAGETFRSYAEDGDRTDPYFEGSLHYANTDHSSLNWTANYGVEEPNSIGVLVRKTFRTGLQATYSFSGRISWTAALYYHHDENEGLISTGATTGFSQDSFDLSLGLAYQINQRFALRIGYNRSDVGSTGSVQDYSRNRYSAGVNFTY